MQYLRDSTKNTLPLMPCPCIFCMQGAVGANPCVRPERSVRYRRGFYFFGNSLKGYIWILIGILLLTGRTNLANAYEVKASMKPTDLIIDLKVKSQPIHNNFTRYIEFKNNNNESKYVAVAFLKDSYLRYTGHVTTEGLDILADICEENNRSYWDKMYFVNLGGSTALDIDWMEIWIAYGNHSSPWEPNMMIGAVTNKYSNEGNDSFYVSGYTGRRHFVQDYFGLSDSKFLNFPKSLRYFLYDLGKSGSSGIKFNPDNPKYGLTGSNLCSETVSWYYYEYDEHISSFNFKDIQSHAVMHDIFKETDRLYCYHLGRKQWIKKDQNYNWVYSDVTRPLPGDYLDRRDSDPDSSVDNGHAMMMLAWDQTNLTADVIDGPSPVALRKVDVDTEEENDRDYCLGIIPSNDAVRENQKISILPTLVNLLILGTGI
ncbi:MAG: hypothetical protein D3923_01300 [Candidatus Electrothrix sp. AR3]|nr:hypothetical protein [Candidatus Electrothrix sp. AR3]